jgi:hypothetical protein
MTLADHGSTVIQGPGMDYAEHERTYRMFLTLLKWAAGLVAVILILMAYFLG